MIKWGTLQTQILEGVLKDPNGTNATPEQMLIWARWACAEISNHTAEPVSITFQGDGVTSKFALPDDIIDGVEKAGMVIYNDGSSLNYLPSLHPSPDTLWPVKQSNNITGFFEWPAGVLSFGWLPVDGTSIEVRYFRIWEPPTSNDSFLMFPRWMEHPFAYFIAAYAMDPQAVQASSIRQWNRKQDSGTPLDNPLQTQSAFFIKQAYRLLGLNSAQDRENYYGLKPRVGNSR